MISYPAKGSANISVGSDETCSWIMVDNELVAITVECYHPDHYQAYFVHVQPTERINSILREIDFDFYSANNVSEARDEYIEKLLHFFAPGTFITQKDTTQTYWFPDQPDVFVAHNSEESIAQCTKKRNELSPDITAKYKAEIEQGFRPIVLSYSKTYFDGDDYMGPAYILDGHHKLAAYQAAHVLPNIWHIVERADRYELIKPEIGQYVDYPAIIRHELARQYQLIRNQSGDLIRLEPLK